MLRCPKPVGSRNGRQVGLDTLTFPWSTEITESIKDRGCSSELRARRGSVVIWTLGTIEQLQKTRAGDFGDQLARLFWDELLILARVELM